MQKGIYLWNWQKISYFRYLKEIHSETVTPVSLKFNSPNHLHETDISVTTLKSCSGDQNTITIINTTTTTSFILFSIFRLISSPVPIVFLRVHSRQLGSVRSPKIMYLCCQQYPSPLSADKDFGWNVRLHLWVFFFFTKLPNHMLCQLTSHQVFSHFENHAPIMFHWGYIPSWPSGSAPSWSERYFFKLYMSYRMLPSHTALDSWLSIY